MREALPPEIRGTYAGLAHPHAIGHLQQLGVTAVELRPIHHFVQDGVLLDRRAAELLGLQPRSATLLLTRDTCAAVSDRRRSRNFVRWSRRCIAPASR